MKPLFLVICLFSSVANALDSFDLPKDQIKYIYDGDTFYIHCIEGLRCNNGKLGIRALGMDTPEIKGECDYEISLARAAKRHLVTLKDTSSVIIITPNIKPYDKYNRLLASVSFDGIDWAESIISANLGRVWTGSRGGWC